MKAISANKIFFFIIFTLLTACITGCGEKSDFDDFKDVDVPEAYIEYKEKKNLSKPEQTSERKVKKISKKKKDTKAFSNENKRSLFSRPDSKGIHRNYLYFAQPTPLEKRIQFTRGLKLIDQGQGELGVEKLEHLASISSQHTELCSQIFFTISEFHGKKGNIKKSNEYFDKFNSELKKLRKNRKISQKAGEYKKAAAGLEKFYKKPDKGQIKND